MATPMLAALREHFKDARITIFAGSAAAADVVEGSSLCDEVKIFPLRRKGIWHMLKAFLAIRHGFDVAIVCTRLNPSYALLLRFVSGISMVVGDSESARPTGATLSARCKQGEHRVAANMRILRLIAPAAATRPTYFHLPASDLARADRYLHERGVGAGPLYAIHPGSDRHEGMDKRIPSKLYLEIIEGLLTHIPGARIVVIFGPGELELADEVVSDARVIVAKGLPLRVVAGVLLRSVALIAGDTGLGHIAAALGTRTITLAGPTDLAQTAPGGKSVRVVKTLQTLECMPCYGTRLYANCPIEQRCMRTIKFDQVMSALANDNVYGIPQVSR